MFDDKRRLNSLRRSIFFLSGMIGSRVEGIPSQFFEECYEDSLDELDPLDRDLLHVIEKGSRFPLRGQHS